MCVDSTLEGTTPLGQNRGWGAIPDEWMSSGVGCTRGTGGMWKQGWGRTNKPPQLKGGLDQCEPGSSVWLILCVSSVIEQSVPEYVKVRNWQLAGVCGVATERRNHQIGRCWKRLGGLMTGWMSGNRAWRVGLAAARVPDEHTILCLAVRRGFCTWAQTDRGRRTITVYLRTPCS